MATLYEMTKEYKELYDTFDAINDIEFASDGNGGYLDDDGNPVDPAAARAEMQQAWYDTLEGLEPEIEGKAEAIGVFVKNLSAEADKLKEEESNLKKRRLAKESKVEQLKKYLLDSLETAHLSKVDTPRAYISVRNNAESVSISDEKAFIEWARENDDGYLRYKEPEISKTAVKSALKDGNEIPFAELIRTKSLTIK